MRNLITLSLIFFLPLLPIKAFCQSDTLTKPHYALVIDHKSNYHWRYCIKPTQLVRIKIKQGRFQKGRVTNVTADSFTINGRVYSPLDICFIRKPPSRQVKLVVGSLLVGIGGSLIVAESQYEDPWQRKSDYTVGGVVATAGFLVLGPPADGYGHLKYDFKCLPLDLSGHPIQTKNDSSGKFINWRGEEFAPNCLMIEPKKKSLRKNQTSVIPVGDKIELIDRSNHKIEGIIDSVTLDTVYVGQRYAFAFGDIREIRNKKTRQRSFAAASVLVINGAALHAFKPGIDTPDDKRNRWVLSGILAGSGMTVGILANGKSSAQKNIFKAGYVKGL